MIEFFPHRIKKRITQIVLDGCTAAFAVFIAYQLRFDFAVPPNYARAMWFWMAAMAVLRPASLWLLTGYRSIWRFLRVQDVLSLIYASLPLTGMLLALRLGVRHSLWISGIPLSVIALEFATFTGICASLRGLRRAAYEETMSSVAPRRRSLLLSTEQTLEAALTQVSTFPELEVIGLVAPGKHLHGYEIGRVPVLGEPGELGALLPATKVDVILIADTNLDFIADAASLASEFGVDLRLMPSAANIMRNEVHVAAPVDAERAFGKSSIPSPPPPAVLEAYSERVVLVTGAGGSIGSELSRQVSGLGISRLVLLDNSENSIFEIERELRQSAASLELAAIVGDVRDSRLLEHLFQRHRPHIVLHSAAYKHVPVMEANPSEAFLNNVIGTRNVLDAAIDARCERFVMISSDKAVAPTSVMGATKRLGEMLVRRHAAWSGDTRLACVRFGNVVGSRGSVIPIFLKQIAEGKPITLTDPRMTRYFMTTREAVQLVLQASTLASRGEIYMLDMGDPIEIGALARKLIESSGLQPDKDISIEVVGVRPGEKIRESLWGEKSCVSGTVFPRVLTVNEGEVSPEIEADINELEKLASARRDMEVLSRLRAMPIDYCCADAQTLGSSAPAHE